MQPREWWLRSVERSWKLTQIWRSVLIPDVFATAVPALNPPINDAVTCIATSTQRRRSTDPISARGFARWYSGYVAIRGRVHQWSTRLVGGLKRRVTLRTHAFRRAAARPHGDSRDQYSIDHGGGLQLEICGGALASKSQKQHPNSKWPVMSNSFFRNPHRASG